MYGNQRELQDDRGCTLGERERSFGGRYGTYSAAGEFEIAVAQVKVNDERAAS